MGTASLQPLVVRGTGLLSFPIPPGELLSSWVPGRISAQRRSLLISIDEHAERNKGVCE